MIAAPFDRWFQTRAPHRRTVAAALLLVGIVATGVGCNRKSAAEPCGGTQSREQAMATFRRELDEQKKIVETRRTELANLREWLDIDDPDPEYSSGIVEIGGEPIGLGKGGVVQRRLVHRLERRVESLRSIGAIRLDAKFTPYGVPGTKLPVKDLQSWLEASQQTPTDTLALLQDTLSSLALYERQLLEKGEKGDEAAMSKIADSVIRDKMSTISYAAAKAMYLNQKKIFEAGQKKYDEILAGDAN